MAVYVLILHVSYLYLVVPSFGYQGSIYNSPPLVNIVLAWICGIVPSLWMPVEIRRPSEVIYSILYCFVVIPIAIVPVYRFGVFWVPFLRIYLPTCFLF